jgi:hypothetical protein
MEPELPLKGGGGGGTYGGMDALKDYIDARDQAVEARLTAKFDAVLSRLDTLKETLPSKTAFDDNRKSLVNTIIGTGIAIFVGMLAVLAFGGDRFDGGLSVSPELAAMNASQSTVDKRQDDQMKVMDDKLNIIIKQTAKP